MEQDMKCKRGEFIDKFTTVRETFSFALNRSWKLSGLTAAHCMEL